MAGTMLDRLKSRQLCGLIGLFLSATPVLANSKVSLDLVADGLARRGEILPIEARAVIADGWHVHSNKPPKPYLIPTVLTLDLPSSVGNAEIFYPPPLQQTFAFAPGLELSVYEGKLGIAAGIQVPADYVGDTLRIEGGLRYQACNDTTCLPPATVKAVLEVRVDSAAAAVRSGEGGSALSSAGAAGGGGQIFATWLAERGLLFTLLAVALLGLGLNLTPCVYPLISVTVAYFGGQASSRGRVAWLAALYVIGIALSFSILGVSAALSGGFFGAALQNPIVIVSIAALMVVLALSSFGVYELRPPTALMTWAGNTGGGAAGALFMGLTMGVVAAPCVGPIVIGLLLFVGSRQDIWLGFSLFFALAIGMGAPYLLLALAAGSIKQLPRSGEWLLWTERLFGCILLAMAAYFLATLLPPPFKTLLLPAVVVMSGIYLGFVERAGHAVPWFPAIKRVVGSAMLIFGAWLAVPVSNSQAIAWEQLEAWNDTRDGSGPVLIDFVAEWCIPCREMDHSTYVDEEVIAEASRFRMVKADLTDEDDASSKVVEEFSVQGVPTVILRSADGHEEARMVGYVGPEEMLQAMRSVH